MKRLIPMVVLAVLLSTLALSCGGGGSSSGGGSSNPDAPVLNSVTMNPNSAPAGSRQYVYLSFTFTDRNGDLGGGALYVIDPITNKTESLKISESFNGVTDGGGYTSGIMLVGPEKGTYSVPFWLVDKAGNKSNIVYVEWSQTKIRS